ncbi:MAG: LuxR C-terminal-related transcriptional regulator [Syntrophomonas sp.]
MLADGCTNHQIAEQLNISLSTVKSSNGSIYSKLQVKTRVQCINAAKDIGLI